MPNTLEETVVEVMARAMSPGLFDGNDAAVDGSLASQVRFEMQESARSRARAILAALDKAGLVVVPREPTEEMIDAACSTFPDIDPGWRDAVIAYTAMLVAAKTSPIAAPAVRSGAQSAPGITHPQAPYTPEPRKEEL